MKKLIVLSADLDIQNAMQGLLMRHEALGFYPLSLKDDVDFVRHPNRDSGCYINAAEYLRYAVRKYEHALVLFDREGCGKDNEIVDNISAKVEDEMRLAGWIDPAVIVFDPELETWVWSCSPKVDEELGWMGASPPLRQWLKMKGFLNDGMVKPLRPKEALEAALRKVQKPRSARIYLNLAQRVGLSRCKDNSFEKFRQVMVRWFPKRKYRATSTR